MWMKKNSYINMIGQRYGRWTVLERAGRNKHKQVTWLCRCECGRERVVVGHDLRSGGSKGCVSCGSRESATTHGGKGTRLYNIWCNLRQRCSNENHPRHKDYGGRGIAVCSEWDAFEAFRDWAISHGCREDLQIDRINNDGNYEPSNCRWATLKQQARNSRHNVHITINGVTKLLCEWAEIAGINYGTLKRRYQRGRSGVRLLAPPHQR